MSIIINVNVEFFFSVSLNVQCRLVDICTPIGSDELYYLRFFIIDSCFKFKDTVFLTTFLLERVFVEF